MAKTYVGSHLRRLRESHRLSQVALADRLGISASYLNQLERGKRPLTVSVLIRVTEEFGVDADFFATRDAARLAADVRTALREHIATGKVSETDIAELTSQMPEIAAAMVAMHRRQQDTVDQTAALLESHAGHGAVSVGPQPHEEVRDFFYARHNHVAELDDIAEETAARWELEPENARERLVAELAHRHGVRVVSVDDDAIQHRLDVRQRVLYLAARLAPGQQAFRMATQLALLEHRDLIARLADAAGFATDTAKQLARIGLANYFAGALILPYGRIRARAEEYRYDVERLAEHFEVGFETICHRLSTLQRPRQRGVPFSFIRVDRAGNISKRQSATGFHFSKAGGTCPLWTVYEAFAMPDRLLVQVAAMPDNRRYLWLAKTVRYRRGGYRSPGKEFAIGLGCELRHARKLVYSQGLDLNDPDAATPIGMGCKVCERVDCAQRAFPPVGGSLRVDERAGTFIPYPTIRK